MREKKTSKEKSLLIGFAVLILAFSLVKGAEAQYFNHHLSQRRYSGAPYPIAIGNFYNFYYDPFDNGYRWYNDSYYKSLRPGVYGSPRRRYYY